MRKRDMIHFLPILYNYGIRKLDDRLRRTKASIAQRILGRALLDGDSAVAASIDPEVSYIRRRLCHSCDFCFHLFSRHDCSDSGSVCSYFRLNNSGLSSDYTLLTTR